MKITDIEAIIIRPPALDLEIADGSQDDLVIRVETDDGISGIGEVDSSPEAVKAVVDSPGSHAVARSLKDLLIGENPLEVERLWQKMYQGLIYHGRRGISLHAISGIDIALWDIKGKAEGKPVCQLLGAPLRDKVRAYASVLMPGTTQGVAELVSRLRSQGFTAIKLGWGPLGKDPANDVALSKAAKAAAGEGDVMIDAGLGYGSDSETAIAVARELEKLEILWLEEPFEPDEFEAYATLADTVDLPVAAGEQDTTVWGFRELIERGHVDVVQPDVTRCGGITELLRIGALARARGVKTVPHAWKSGIVKAASLHVNAVLPDASFQECCVTGSPINSRLTHTSPEIDAEGFLSVPRSPGLGVELDLEFVEQYRVG